MSATDDYDFKKTPEQTPPEPSSTKESIGSEPVWTYRGYQLRASEFNTAMVHLFRAEVNRANIWRQRLDTTTNWAVITTFAVLSIAFTQTSSHFVIALNLLLVTFFLFIEARRYRYYELWSYRIRLMETDFFAAMLVPPFQPSPDWAEALAEHLLHPHFPISTWEALGRRLRRNYLWIYAIILAAWIARLWLVPTPTSDWLEIIDRASVGQLDGRWVLLITLTFFLIVLGFSMYTIGLQESAGEVLPRFGGMDEIFPKAGKSAEKLRAWFRPSRKRPQLLTFIITDNAKAVAERILKEMGRGVTGLSGKGMYTDQSLTVLMCALTVTEVPNMKAVVHAEDPNAFMIVSPAQEVFGKGFMPLGVSD